MLLYRTNRIRSRSTYSYTFINRHTEKNRTQTRYEIGIMSFVILKRRLLLERCISDFSSEVFDLVFNF